MAVVILLLLRLNLENCPRREGGGGGGGGGGRGTTGGIWILSGFMMLNIINFTHTEFRGVGVCLGVCVCAEFHIWF